jgi:hypothetical protein
MRSTVRENYSGRRRKIGPALTWHSAKALRVPASITLVPLPPYSPELNPVERVWLYLKERFLSMRLLNDYDAIVAAASKAWKRLCRETGRLTSLTSYPWIIKAMRWVVCHEHRGSTPGCTTQREMKEGPSGSAIRSRAQATASCCGQKPWW